MTMLLELVGGVSIVVGSYLYWQGHLRCRSLGRGPINSLRLASFGTGLLLIVVSLYAMEEVAESYLSAHMLQHVLLFIAPLPLVVARSATGMLLGIDPVLRSRLTAPLRWIRGRMSVLGRRPVAWAILSGSLAVWHIPVVFQAAVISPLLHAVEHFVFFASAGLWWYSLVGAGPRRSGSYGASMLSIFGTMMLGTAVGSLLTFSTTPWYPLYVARVEAAGWDWLVDQQLAGVIMWVPPGVVLIAVFVWFGSVWLRSVEVAVGRRTT